MAGHDIFDPVSHPGRKLLFRFEHSVLDGTRPIDAEIAWR